MSRAAHSTRRQQPTSPWQLRWCKCALALVLGATLVLALVSAGGCRSGNKVHRDAARVEAAVHHKVSESLRRQRTNSRPLVTEDNSFWVPLQPKPWKREEPLPPVFEKQVSLHVQDVGIDIVAELLRRMSGLLVTLRLEPAGGSERETEDEENSGDDSSSTEGGGTAATATTNTDGTRAAVADEDEPDCHPRCVVLSHNGTLRALLDALHTTTGLSWRYQDGTIEIFRVQSRVFPLYGFLGIRSWSQDVSLESSTVGADAGSASSNKVTYDSNAVNAAEALQNTLENILSPWGALSISTAANNVVVTDTPTTLARMERYINRLNEQMSRQALLRVAVYEVRDNADSGFGFDFRGMVRRLSNGVADGLSLQIPSIGGGGADSSRFVINYNNNSLSHEQQYNLLIDALRSESSVSLVTTSTLHVMHNMPAPVYVGEETAYISSVTSVVNDNTTTTSFESDTIRNGFGMSIMPSIFDGRIQLHYSININTLLELQEFEAGGNTIRLPRTRNKTIVQQAMLHSGDTLVLSGFATTRSNTNSALGVGNYRSGSGGNRQRIVILITPWLLDNGPSGAFATNPTGGGGTNPVGGRQ